MKLDAKTPSGPLAEKWDKHKFEMKLVNPANKRKYTAIVVGTGLAGASAAATMAELGYNVKAFCFQAGGCSAAEIDSLDSCFPKFMSDQFKLFLNSRRQSVFDAHIGLRVEITIVTA